MKRRSLPRAARRALRPAAPRLSDQVTATEFKARCLELMDRVRQEGRSVVVTKRGRPVVRVIPYEERTKPILGFVHEGIISYGDIVTPADEPWEADAP